MALLQLLSLHCTRTEDWTGADEAYIQVGANRVWGGSINDGETELLAGTPAVAFTGSTTVRLFDEDSPPLDPDDQLGQLSVSAGLAGLGVRTHRFTGHGADYTLSYEVY